VPDELDIFCFHGLGDHPSPDWERQWQGPAQAAVNPRLARQSRTWQIRALPDAGLAVAPPLCRASARGHSPNAREDAEPVKRPKHCKALLVGTNDVFAMTAVLKERGSRGREQAAAILSPMPHHNASIRSGPAQSRVGARE
jgi:hypothetical protein